MLNLYLKEAKIPKVLNTTDAFDQLFPVHKTDSSHRMKQLYSYDVRESQMFMNTFKAEERIKAEIAEVRRSKVYSEYVVPSTPGAIIPEDGEKGKNGDV